MSEKNKFTDEIALILMFKDKLNRERIFGLPLGHYSNQIDKHFKNENKKFQIKEEFKTYYKNIRKKKIGDISANKNFAMWGWWKKYGENYDHVFEFIDKKRNGKIIHTFLYNQYAKLIYKTRLHEIIHIPILSCILPLIYKKDEKEYIDYYNQLHLCGAYFYLELEENKKMKISGKYLPRTIEFNEIFDQYRIHPSSFNYGFNEPKEKFPQKEKDIVELIYNKNITKYDLKRLNQTILCLVKKDQYQKSLFEKCTNYEKNKKV